MKSRDIAVILVVAFIAALASFGISRVIFGGQKTHNLTAPTVEQIVSDFNKPDAKYFNGQSIDITRAITIGDTTNPDPLKTKTR
jgi:hypothetical protein